MYENMLFRTNPCGDIRAENEIEWCYIAYISHLFQKHYFQMIFKKCVYIISSLSSKRIAVITITPSILENWISAKKFVFMEWEV